MKKKHKDKPINIKDTAIEEYFEVVRGEYEIERNKRSSFENRIGLIIALLGGISIFLFEEIKLGNIFLLMQSSLTFLICVKIISGLATYFCFIFTIVMIGCTITTKLQDNFEVKYIDEDLLIEEKKSAVTRIIFAYRDIINSHRALNEKRAKTFQKSLYGISGMLIFIMIYINI